MQTSFRFSLGNFNCTGNLLHALFICKKINVEVSIFLLTPTFIIEPINIGVLMKINASTFIIEP